MFKKILVCIDGSERSIKAAVIGAELANVHKAGLTLLHTCQLPTPREPFPGAPKFALPLLNQYEKDIKEAVLARTVPSIQAIGQGYDVLEETGDPVEVIVRVADSRGFDLIVMGGRNMSVDKAAQLGSVSHGVLCRAHCPVLVIR